MFICTQRRRENVWALITGMGLTPWSGSTWYLGSISIEKAFPQNFARILQNCDLVNIKWFILFGWRPKKHKILAAGQKSYIFWTPAKTLTLSVQIPKIFCILGGQICLCRSIYLDIWHSLLSPVQLRGGTRVPGNRHERWLPPCCVEPCCVALAGRGLWSGWKSQQSPAVSRPDCLCL